MTCSKTEMITDFILGELPLEQREEVNKHINNCNYCQQEYKTLTKITKGLKDWSDSIEIPDSFEQRMEAALQAEIKPPKKRPRPLPYLAACIMVLAVAIGLWEGYQTIISHNIALEQNIDETKEIAALDKTKPIDAAENKENRDSGGVEPRAFMAENKQGLMATESSTAKYKIPPEMVKSVEVLTVDRTSKIINNKKLMLMLVSAINTAKQAPKKNLSSYTFTHTINISLNDGTVYKVKYNAEEKVAVFKGIVILPDSQFANALQQIENIS